MSKKASECKSLNELRTEIDIVDREIVELIAKRFGFVREVVNYRTPGKKVEHDKVRFEQVIKQRGNWGVENGLNGEVVENVYRILLTYFVDEQKKIALEIENN